MNQDYDVYISYAPENRDQVRMLARELSDVGLKVWWENQPSELNGGTDLLKATLGPGKVQVVVWSHVSAASGRIQAEARVGSELNRQIAVRFETVIPPRESPAHTYADLNGWFGGQEHQGIVLLHNAVHALTGKGIQPGPPPPPPAADNEEKDHRAWQKTLRYDNVAMYENYLKYFPNGIYVAEAKRLLEEKKQKSQNGLKIVLGIGIGFVVLYIIYYVAVFALMMA